MFSVLAGCGIDEAPVPLGQIQQHTGGFDEQYNGRWIVGEEFEKPRYSPANVPEYFNVSTTGTREGRPDRPETVALSGPASLRVVGGGDIIGIILSSPQVQVKITSARRDGVITHYALDVLGDKGVFTQVCDDAIPLAGVIDRTGGHQPSPGRITFVCKDGAAHKCVIHGYPPGLPGSDMWGVHQACTQMFRADYCGRGIANTRIGTSIEFYDNAGVHQVPAGTELPIMTADLWPPNTTDYYFEAAFRTGQGPALCSARARWPLITDDCIAAIPDCPHDTVDHLIDPGGAMMFVASRFSQLRFDTWHNGDDWVSTVRGYYNYGQDVGKAPWDGYAHVGTNGMLLRIPPTIVDSENIVAVSLFQGRNQLGGNDYVVARSDDPRFIGTSYDRVGEEGHVYLNQSSVPNPQALRMYRHKTTGDLTSTTAEVSNTSYEPAFDPRTGSNFIGWMAGLP